MLGRMVCGFKSVNSKTSLKTLTRLCAVYDHHHSRGSLSSMRKKPWPVMHASDAEIDFIISVVNMPRQVSAVGERTTDTIEICTQIQLAASRRSS